MLRYTLSMLQEDVLHILTDEGSEGDSEEHGHDEEAEAEEEVCEFC